MAWESLPPEVEIDTRAPRRIISWQSAVRGLRSRDSGVCGAARSCLATVMVGQDHASVIEMKSGEITYSGSPPSSLGGQTVTAAIAAAGWPETKHENRQKLPASALVRAGTRGGGLP